ncbi:serine hydrolase domain-containing protein [Robiginitalea sp. IMCC44478]|uniref:serine hydrolase domain-containing protein n=1 Tax=Robiginitalea sp. IMCC44478 TaxID=3459122 RepID=UPI004042DCC5
MKKRFNSMIAAGKIPGFRQFLFCSLMLLACMACSTEPLVTENPGPDPTNLYFPEPQRFADWETVSPESLGWDSQQQNLLETFLETNDTKAFIILKDGKIAMERYFGTFTRDSLWYWASAGKTLTAYTVGLAREEGLLNLEDPTSAYLGPGWTSAPSEKELNISIRNQLSMTSGLDELSFDCVLPECLNFTADAGSRWAYHNGPYTLLQDVVSNAAGMGFSEYFNNRLRNKIGMDGFWISSNGSNSIYYSTPRSMARFGLLVLNNGSWGDLTVMSDASYHSAMLQPSQDLNKAYGYLWWLNGKQSYMAPASQIVFPGKLIPEAPSDLVAGLGKNDQKLYIVPSQKLVIVRMGQDSGENLLGPSSFDNQLWQQLGAFIK